MPFVEISLQIRHIAIMILLAVTAGSVSGQEVTEQAVFCRINGRIKSDSYTMKTAEWRNRVVCDFLRYAVPSADITAIDYCDNYRSLMMDDSTSISIDRVTFPSCDMALAKWLNDIPDSTYIEPDIPAEAPEKCIAFRKDSTLVIVWCNLFADSDKVYHTAKSFIFKEMAEDTPVHPKRCEKFNLFDISNKKAIFATCLIERGTDLKIVKELMGHNSIRTTEIYVHIADTFKSNIKSPLDDILEEGEL